MLEDQQKTIKKSIREVDREKNRMTREEQKDVQRLKKAAKEGQMGAVQEIAKAIAKNRKHVTQLYKLETKLQSFHTQIQGIKSQAVMLKGIREITRAMGQMNKSFSVGAFSIILNEFKSQSLELSTKEEMIEESTLIYSFG